MRLICWIVLVMAPVAAAQEIVLKAERMAHMLVLKEVYLSGQGPFRMLIDSGASSCAIRPSLARKLGLHPAYAVELETAAGVKRVPAVRLDELRIGTVRNRDVEALVTEIESSRVDGVLGQSWLAQHDYLLDFRSSRLVLNAAAPEHGVTTALRSSDGRPQIAADVNGRSQDLVVDSGTSDLILFGRSRFANPVELVTNSGSVEAETGSSRVKIGSNFSRLMTSAAVDASPRPGLLPAAAFASVYVSNRNGVVVLVPR